MTRPRIGVIGGGYGAYCYVPAIRRDGRADVAWLWSRTPDRAAAMAERFSVTAAGDAAEAMIGRGDVDAVVLAVPPAMQVRLAHLCLQQGLPVMCEKPLAVTMQDAAGLAALARQKGVATAVDFLFPELHSWQRAFAALQDGAIGLLQHVTLDWQFHAHDLRTGKTGWKSDAQSGGGALSYFACHALHYFEWFAGPLAQVQALLGRAPSANIAADTLVGLNLHFASGVTGTATICSAAPGRAEHRLNLLGTSGSLELANAGANTVDFTLNGVTADGSALDLPVDAEPFAADEDPRVVPLSRLFGRFLDSVSGGDFAGPDFGHGARVQYLIEAIRSSADSGSAVEIAPPSHSRILQ